MGTFGCLGFPCLLIVMNLLVPCGFEATEINSGQRAAALRGYTLHTRMLFIATINTVDTVGSVDMHKHKLHGICSISSQWCANRTQMSRVCHLERLKTSSPERDASSISGVTIFSIISVNTVNVGCTMKSINPAKTVTTRLLHFGLSA